MKYVLITGAGGGLGLELVKEHLKEDYTIFALARKHTAGLSELYKNNNEKLIIIECDISSTEQVESAMKIVTNKTNTLHRIFNNAGIHRFEDWVNLDKTELDFLPEMYNINAVGALRIVKQALPLLKNGSIVINISSEAASLKNQTATIGYAYAMSKAAMNMGAIITDNWLKEKGIRTLMIHPGRMRTAMKGSHSNIDPWETSESLMKMLDNINSIPAENLFMDYKGNVLDW